MQEFITIKIVSCFTSLQTCVFIIIKLATEIKASAKGDLNIWKLSLLYSLSRAVHRLVQRKQFTLVLGVQNLSVGKDKLHREMDLFRDAQEKTAMDNLQSARTHNFLTLNFP